MQTALALPTLEDLVWAMSSHLKVDAKSVVVACITLVRTGRPARHVQMDK
jgi:hypothetical protein